MTEFCIDLIKRAGFTEKEQEYLIGFSKTVENNSMYNNLLETFKNDVEKGEEVYEKLPEASANAGVNFYTLALLFFIEAAEAAYPKYLALGLSEDYFYNNMIDLKRKNDECYSVNKVIGTHSVMGWFRRFYIPDRFRLGRLVFETTFFKLESYEKYGVSLKKNDVVINVHIPSGEPLNIEEAKESFKLAYDFFKKYHRNGKLVFACHSWLLYEKHREFLNPESNIRKFMELFDIIDTTVQDEFSNMWRVFSVETIDDFNKLPEDTSLQRAYKKWLLDGNKAGFSYGIRVQKGE